MLHQLTKEQLQCVSTALSGQNLKIKAFAGTGKTSTLIEIAKMMQGKGLYLAYNKAIKDDAEGKFPNKVESKTAHSLAYSIYGRKYKKRIRYLTIHDIVNNIEINELEFYDNNGIAYLAIKLLRNFCNSESTEINKYLLNAAIYASIDIEEPSKIKQIIESVINCAAKYWEKCIKSYSYLPIEHDFYLKMYQLSNPNLYAKYDYILFDECQDANPVILDILTKQKCQKIYVGDEHQQIYGWRGAINAFSHLEGVEHYLSQSFRFGTAIGEIASNILILKGEKIALKGMSNINTEILSEEIEPCAVLCRTNARIIENIINSKDKKLHVIGGVDEILNLAKSGFGLYKRNYKVIKHNKIKQYKSWTEMVKLNSQYKDADITFLIALINSYRNDFQSIIWTVERANYVSEKEADIVLSTIHKSKGREWNNVTIEDDFTIFDDNNLDSILALEKEELNILYVAITRAKKGLYMSNGVSEFYNKLVERVNRIN